LLQRVGGIVVAAKEDPFSNARREALVARLTQDTTPQAFWELCDGKRMVVTLLAETLGLEVPGIVFDRIISDAYAMQERPARREQACVEAIRCAEGFSRR